MITDLTTDSSLGSATESASTTSAVPVGSTASINGGGHTMHYTPGRFDVIFGRGKFSREHSGNQRCKHLATMHYEEYEKASKFQKSVIAENIIGIVQKSDGRFLEWDETHNNKSKMTGSAAKELLASLQVADSSYG